MASRELDYELCLRVPAVDPYAGYDLSPDGGRVAFSWNRTGQWEVYVLDLGTPSQPRQLTHGPGAKFGARFSADGRWLLYALDLDGSENFDIWLCDLANGEHCNLTPDTPEAIQPNLCWSPDGRWIAFISDRSRRFDTYVLPLDLQAGMQPVGDPRLVFDGLGPNWDVSWSPDGGWLGVVAEGSGQDSHVALVQIQAESTAGEQRFLDWEGRRLNARQICWSPDGKRLAFSSDVSGEYQLGIYALESGRIEWATNGPGDKSEPDWSPDGNSLAYVHSLGPETWLAVQALGKPAPERFQVEPGVHFMPRFTPDGRKILFVFDSPRRPDDLWMLDLDDKSFRQLTQSLPEGLAPEDFSMPKHIYYPSPDGRSVPALLYIPTGRVSGNDSKPPAVIVIHGGPSWLFQYLWYPLMAHMVSRGWVVLAPNYRGSTGYGREWQHANRFEMGRGDTMDVVAGADYLIRERLADPQRIAVTGRSHGGYLTMSCLTSYPERWAVGSAVVPFLNWFTSNANSRQDLQHWDIENMGDPVQNADLWRERSPYFYLDRISAPVQLICGAHDPRCPASESVAARDALLGMGKRVDFLLYPDEGHTFLKIENIVSHELRRVAFLAQVLERPDEEGTT